MSKVLEKSNVYVDVFGRLCWDTSSTTWQIIGVTDKGPFILYKLL